MIWTYNAMGTYVLVLTLATILVCVLLLLLRRSQGAGGLGLVSGLIGVLLGAAGAGAAVQLLDYDVVKVRPNMGASPAAGGASDAGSQPAGSGAMGMGMGGMMGSGGMGGMGGGGMGGPNPKRDLTTLVRKVNLLTSDIALTLTPEQSAGLVKILDPLASKASLTDDEATALHDELLALFDEGQKAKQDAIGLPFRRGGGSGGPGGGMGGPGGAAKPEPDANPFEQEQNAEALQSLLARFGGAPAAEMAPESTAETPEAKPAEALEEKPAEAADAKPAETPEAKPAEAPEVKPAEAPEEKPSDASKT
jgi:hypothetical protein